MKVTNPNTRPRAGKPRLRAVKVRHAFTHKMKRVAQPGARVLFEGLIAPGTGDHYYTCAACAAAVLSGVDVRHPSGAVYKCTGCQCLNVVARLEDAPEEARERFIRLYAPGPEA